MDIKGRKALVFGGTSGIGLATVTRLVAGRADVVAIGRSESRAKDLPAGARFAACDVTDRNALEALLAAEAPFDILISAATGGERAIGPFLDMDMDGFQASFAKLWGYTNVVRYGAHHLGADGTIVLVSGAPARKAKPGQIALGSVGAAVEQFVRTVAAELVPRRINVVSPGTIDTPLIPGDGADRAEKLRAGTAANLIPRPGTPDEVAKAILFAVENDFVTGTTIDVDGGWLLA